MSTKDIQEAIGKKNVVFGIKQILKNVKKDKKNPFKSVYIAKDAREHIKQTLLDHKIGFESLKTKAEITKELKLNFESEVMAIR